MIFRIAILILSLMAGMHSGRADDLAGSHDLVIGARNDATRVRVVLLVDGQTVASRRGHLLDSIVARADHDGNGMLGAEEWRRAVMLIGARPAEAVPKKEQTAEAAARALDASWGAAWEFVEQPRPLVDRLELFEGLDANDDRQLTHEEFADATELIDWYDADGDGVLSMPELAPTEPLRPIPLTTSARLPAGRYPFTWEASSGMPDVVVEIKLIAQAFGRPKIETRVVGKNGSDSKKVEVTPGRRSVELKIGELTLVLDARTALISSQDVKRFFLLQMRQRDADKNGYLDEGEFTGLALPELSFEMADANDDGMLFADELRQKLDGLIARETNRVQIEISYERDALFTRLDRDEDDRLSRRELMAAGSHAGVKKEDAIVLEDFGGRYRLEFGTPNLLEEASPPMVAGVRAMARARMNPSGEGPAWFRAMDRNGDGDLFRREFLGTSDKFQEIDTDDNGLLALQEIEDWSAAMKK